MIKYMSRIIALAAKDTEVKDLPASEPISNDFIGRPSNPIPEEGLYDKIFDNMLANDDDNWFAACIRVSIANNWYTNDVVTRCRHLFEEYEAHIKQQDRHAKFTALQAFKAKYRNSEIVANPPGHEQGFYIERKPIVGTPYYSPVGYYTHTPRGWLAIDTTGDTEETICQIKI